jgi:hypothetical protein
MSEQKVEDVNETVDAALPIVSIFDICGTDEDAAENGKWIKGEDLWPRGAGIELKIRRMTSKKALKTRAELLTKYAKFQNKKGQFPEEIDHRMLCELLAQAVIVDWKGIPDKDGKLIPFTRESAFHLVDKLPDFRAQIVQAAMDMDQFRADDLEQVEGN